MDGIVSIGEAVGEEGQGVRVQGRAQATDQEDRVLATDPVRALVEGGQAAPPPSIRATLSNRNRPRMPCFSL